MKKAMLQNTVSSVKAFKEVKTTKHLDVAKGQQPLPYTAFTNLIQQVAASYDRDSALIT